MLKSSKESSTNLTSPTEISIESTRQVPETETQPTKFNTNIYIAAIDNGLAFPFKHPDEWRACNLTFKMQLKTR